MSKLIKICISNIYKCLTNIISRKHIKKILIKLPDNFFPTYRLIINIVLNVDGKTKKERCKYNCCCREQRNNYYEKLSDDMKGKRKSIERCQVSSSIENPVVPRPPPMPVNLLEIPEGSFDELRVRPSSTPTKIIIGLEEIGNVKLRPSEVRRNSAQVPEVNDMLQILKRRYAAIHSPGFFTDNENQFDSFSAGSENSCSYSLIML
ncbi:unnamed protein product [Brassicogethes aeneus]|uniref:Uncharacterized protein n=1 Tax=Brassicogethes aeneus TaxID=1431903 RepID=A0A9P0B119_BRAAE|nr:unnamed protein product [Brassicogethes aeneus]